MELIGKLALLVLSMLGYFFWISKRHRIPIELTPALFCAGVNGAMFVAGLLNLLQEAAYVVFIAGYILLGWMLVKEKFRPTARECAFLLVFLLCIGYFGIFFRGQELIDYDDFSHWALAARSLLYADAMPADGALVTFQAYPLGSSLLIYYISNIVGSTDACLLWSQSVLLVSLLVSLLALLNRRNAEGVIAIAAFALYSLVMNIPVHALLVDSLMPLIALAGVAVMLSMRERPRLVMISLGLLGAFVTNVKNSGMFFAASMLIIYLWFDPHAVKKHFRWFACGSVLPPFMTWLLWNRHVDMAFTTGFWSKHAMSLEIYEAMAAKKTPDMCRQIAHDVFASFFSFDDVTIRLLLLGTAALVIAGALHAFGTEKRQLGRAIQMSALLWTISFVYEIGIIAMYIFSMPIDEALGLASYPRYERSNALFVFGVALAYALNAYAQLHMSAKRRGAAAVLLTCLFALPVTQRKADLATLYRRIDFTQTDRCRLRRIKEAAGIEQGADATFFRMKYDNGFLYHLSRYELWSHVETVSNDIDEFCERLDKHAYGIVWDYDETIKARVEQTGYPYEEVEGALVLKTDGQ